MEEANVQAPAKKGMSKGCIVGLVVVGVLIVLIVVGGFICYSQREALVKMGMSTMINGVKNQLAEVPIEGVDTVTFNAVADKFMEKLDAEETIDPEKMQALGLQMQIVGQNVENLSAEQVNDFEQAMVNFYPELGEMIPEPPMDDDMEEMFEEADTTGSE